MNETELVIKLGVILLIWNLLITSFALFLGQGLVASTPSFSGFIGIQSKINSITANLNGAISRGDIIGILINVFALVFAGVYAVYSILFVVLPQLFGYTFGALGYIVELIISLVTVIVAVYAFTLTTRIIGRILGGNQ